MKKVSRLSLLFLLPFAAFLLLGLADIQSSKDEAAASSPQIELDFKNESSKKEQNVEIICDPINQKVYGKKGKKWRQHIRLQRKAMKKILLPRNHKRCRIIRKKERKKENE